MEDWGAVLLEGVGRGWFHTGKDWTYVTSPTPPLIIVRVRAEAHRGHKVKCELYVL